MNFLGPTSTIGIISGNQSSFLLAQQALKMGFKVVMLANDSVLASHDHVQLIVGSHHKLADLQQLFTKSDLVVYDNEDLNLDLLNQIEDREKLVQGTELLDLVQDRYLEKSFLNNHNLNVVPFAAVVDDRDLRQTVQEIGFPCILKPIQKDISLIDGMLFHNQLEINQYHVPQGTFILESLLDIQKEFVVIASKDAQNQIGIYPVIQMTSQDRWLHTTLIDPQLDSILQAEIKAIAHTIAQNINFQGLVAIKLCTTKVDTLYVERIYVGTVFAANLYQKVTAYSQEELFLRSVCNWPLPQVHPFSAGCNLVITQNELDFAISQLQQHPQWQLDLMTERLVQDCLYPYLGVITILGDNYRKLQHYVNVTKMWKV